MSFWSCPHDVLSALLLLQYYIDSRVTLSVLYRYLTRCKTTLPVTYIDSNVSIDLLFAHNIRGFFPLLHSAHCVSRFMILDEKYFVFST